MTARSARALQDLDAGIRRLRDLLDNPKATLTTKLRELRELRS
jgi:hypothetical protein